jgi:hypothetical protein
MAVDLEHDVSINGHVFAAGKNVETVVSEPDADNPGQTKEVDYEEAINDVVKSNKKATDFAGKHHGEVKSSEDPLEATAQTPTRPLGNQGANNNNSNNSNRGQGGNKQ